MFFDTSVLVPAVVDQLANREAAFDALLNYTAGSPNMTAQRWRNQNDASEPIV